MTGFGYPESTSMAGSMASSSSSSDMSAVSPAAGYVNLNQSINLLMSAAGGLLVLVGFVAFGIWLCGRCSSVRSSGASSSQEAAAAAIKPGLSREAIARIPVQQMPNSGIECCAICLGEFGSSEESRARVLPRCGHSFHVECIDMWLFSHKTCPTCRGDLSILERGDASSSVAAAPANDFRIVVVDSAGSPASAA